MKPEKIGELRIENVDTKLNMLLSDNYKFNLSTNLCEAIAFYLSHRRDYEKEDYLFTNILDNKSVAESNFYNKFLVDIGKGDILGLVKYRIKKFKEKGIPYIIIKEFTGAGKSIIDDAFCENYIENYEPINSYFEEI